VPRYLKDVAARGEKATPTPEAGRAIATETVMRSAVAVCGASGAGFGDCGTGGGVRGEVFAVLGRLAGSRGGTELFGQPLEFGRRGRGVIEPAVHGRRALRARSETSWPDPAQDVVRDGGQVGHVLLGAGSVGAGLSGCVGAQACGTASQSDSSGQRDHHGDQEYADEFLGTEAAGENEQCGSRGDHQ